MKYNYKNGESIILDAKNKFAAGGEGSIFLHPKKKNKCVKIYHNVKSKTLAPVYSDLSKLDSKWFVKPEELLYTDKGDLAGFEMQYVDLNKWFIFKKLTTKSFCDQQGIGRKFKFIVYENMKKAILDAHSKNIVVGDLNPYNIFVNDKGEVLFVDVDSYATKDKPHSGVLLEDIRDYTLHPHINQKTDVFAFDVLIWWMFTYVHPYRGNTKLYKNLEERIVKKASILGAIPDLILPPVYEKFTNQDILKQFFEIFQNGMRFIIDLSGNNIVVHNVPAFQPLNLSSKDLYIRVLDQNVKQVFCSGKLLGLRMQDDSFKIYNVGNYGVFNQKDHFSAENIFIGDENYLKMNNGALSSQNGPIKNIILPLNYKSIVINNTLFVIDEDNNMGMKIAIDSIINGQISNIGMPIFSPSIQIGDSIVQFIGDSNWFLIPSGTNHNTVKTNLNIKNAYYRGGIFCIEHLDNNKIKYSLYKCVGTQLEHIYDLSEFCYFDVKGEYVYVPQDNKIDLISILRKEVIMTIDCGVCTNYSRIFHTNSGMLIHTDDKIYLVNKKV